MRVNTIETLWVIMLVISLVTTRDFGNYTGNFGET